MSSTSLLLAQMTTNTTTDMRIHRYGGGANPYDQRDQPSGNYGYGGQQNPYAQQSNPYAQQQNNYGGQQQNPYGGQQTNNYGYGGDDGGYGGGESCRSVCARPGWN